MNTTYIPRPVDTSDVVLPEEIHELAALMASQVHDIWAQGRQAEGWRYGEHRDGARKLTPCMVPFEDLPASEQAYDLNTAYATLRLIVKTGYTITAPEKKACAAPPRAMGLRGKKGA